MPPQEVTVGRRVIHIPEVLIGGCVLEGVGGGFTWGAAVMKV